MRESVKVGDKVFVNFVTRFGRVKGSRVVQQVLEKGMIAVRLGGSGAFLLRSGEWSQDFPKPMWMRVAV